MLNAPEFENVDDKTISRRHAAKVAVAALALVGFGVAGIAGAVADRGGDDSGLSAERRRAGSGSGGSGGRRKRRRGRRRRNGSGGSGGSGSGSGGSGSGSGSGDDD